jgi:cytochrome c7-like protein/class III cytochrome C family protein
MRTRLILISGAIVLAVGALAWKVAHAMGDDSGRSAAVFTPAHRTVLDAVREFFSVHPPAVQPIAYTHKVHLANGMQCVNCHTGADSGPDARLPSVQLCMTCHQAIAADKPEIRKMAAYLERGEDIPWQRVYDFPPSAHVHFNHAPHLRAGVACEMCHGDMTRQTAAVKAINVNMGFCLDCHRQKRASTDCLTCHY